MLFRNKYRIESSRCPKWDYSSPGYYFITAVTKDRGYFFGEIVDGEMRENEYGDIANEEWHKTGEIRGNIIPDEFVVMPNHIHGIIRILPVETAISKNGQNQNVETPWHGVSTNSKSKQIHWKSGVLGAVIGQFKIKVTKRINEIRTTPGERVFQSRFHDHIIRDEKELFIIRQYIRNNPSNWPIDDELNDKIT